MTKDNDNANNKFYFYVFVSSFFFFWKEEKLSFHILRSSIDGVDLFLKSLVGFSTIHSVI